MSSSTPDTSTTAVSFPLSDKYILTKRGKTTKNVLQRYFFISDGLLVYFKTMNCTKPSGLLPLKGAEYTIHQNRSDHEKPNACIEVKSTLRSWGKIILHLHNFEESILSSLISNIKEAGGVSVKKSSQTNSEQKEIMCSDVSNLGIEDPQGIINRSSSLSNIILAQNRQNESLARFGSRRGSLQKIYNHFQKRKDPPEFRWCIIKHDKKSGKTKHEWCEINEKNELAIFASLRSKTPTKYINLKGISVSKTALSYDLCHALFENISKDHSFACGFELLTSNNIIGSFVFYGNVEAKESFFENLSNAIKNIDLNFMDNTCVKESNLKTWSTEAMTSNVVDFEEKCTVESSSESEMDDTEEVIQISDHSIAPFENNKAGESLSVNIETSSMTKLVTKENLTINCNTDENILPQRIHDENCEVVSKNQLIHSEINSNEDSIKLKGENLSTNMGDIKITSTASKIDIEVVHATTIAESYAGTIELKKYTFLKVVGRGGFGMVVLARCKVDKQIYAIKILTKRILLQLEQVEHTKSERNVLAECFNHHFIVKLQSAFQTKDYLYMVLEYCPGGDLFYHLARVRRFQEHQAAFYIAEVLVALNFLHERNIIYRDLKPENVLLDEFGHVRLADFGLVKENIIEGSTWATSFCGSPEYLPPEVLNRGIEDLDEDNEVEINNSSGYGKSVDYWSLGCLLFELLTGLPPFYSGANRSQLYGKIREAHVTYPSYLSEESIALLKKLLHVEPSTRLGCGQNGYKKIKEEAFFLKFIQWDKLEQGTATPPLKPPVKNVADTSNFDSKFTEMPVPSHIKSYTTDISSNLDYQVFENFSWKA